MEKPTASAALGPRSAPAALAALLLLVPALAVGQAPSTEWTAYTSMRQINDLLRHAGEVWACTSGGLLRYDEANREYTRYTSLDGLASNKVLSVAADLRGHLWFGTDGGGLSRYRPETDAFDPPFVEFEGRRIWSLLAYGERLYVGTDQGISVFLIDREEVKETYRTLGRLPKDTAALALAVSGGMLFAASGEGLSWADLGQANLQDPDSWQTIARDAGSILDLLPASGLVVAAGELGAFIFDPTNGTLTIEYDQEPASALGLLDDRPVLALESGNYLRRDGPGVWQRIPGPIYTGATSLSRSGQDLWIGSGDGLRVIRGPQPPPAREPAANRFYEMELMPGGDLWAASAPNDQQKAYGVSRLGPNGWTVYDRASGMPVDELVALETGPEGRLWLGTWGAGASVLDGGAWLRLTPDSSPLRGVPGAPGFVVVSDIERDDDGVMWLVNVLSGLAVMDGYPARRSFLIEQGSLGLDPNTVDLNKLAIAPDGTKWISSRTHGLVVLDDGGTPFAGGDDEALLVNTAYDSRLSSNRAYDVLVGPDQTLWLATDAGLNAIRATYDRSSGRLDVDEWRVYTTVDGLPINEINALEVDGVGNLWVATQAGLSQIGRDGEVAFTLTAAGSGLASDRVTSLLYDGAAGALWIGTFNGLNRLLLQQGTAEEPVGLTVYPNPFTNRGDLSLTFAGLPLGASLRIYTADGLPVARLPGVPGRGTVTWSGQNDAGFLVGSGVYLYVAEDDDGNRVRGRFAVVTHPGGGP